MHRRTKITRPTAAHRLRPSSTQRQADKMLQHQMMHRVTKINNIKGEQQQTQARTRLTTKKLTTNLDQELPQGAAQRAVPSPIQLDSPPLYRRSVQGALSFMILISVCNTLHLQAQAPHSRRQ